MNLNRKLILVIVTTVILYTGCSSNDTDIVPARTPLPTLTPTDTHSALSSLELQDVTSTSTPVQTVEELTVTISEKEAIDIGLRRAKQGHTKVHPSSMTPQIELLQLMTLADVIEQFEAGQGFIGLSRDLPVWVMIIEGKWQVYPPPSSSASTVSPLTFNRMQLIINAKTGEEISGGIRVH